MQWQQRNRSCGQATTPSQPGNNPSGHATDRQPDTAIAAADAPAKHKATVRPSFAFADQKPRAGKDRQFGVNGDEKALHTYGWDESSPPVLVSPVGVLDSLFRARSRLRT